MANSQSQIDRLAFLLNQHRVRSIAVKTDADLPKDPSIVSLAPGTISESFHLPEKKIAFVSEDEVAMIVEQTRVQREQDVDPTFLEAPQVFVEEHDGDDGEYDPDEDPLLDRAIEVVIAAQTASVSLLQRRLRVGYTRAGRLIDMLERRGIISAYEGSKPRSVLVGEADLDAREPTELAVHAAHPLELAVPEPARVTEQRDAQALDTAHLERFLQAR